MARYQLDLARRWSSCCLRCRFDAKIWSEARNPEGWRSYTHYDDCKTDTCLLYDHVHVSVYERGRE